MIGTDVLPQLELAPWRVDLGSHVTGLGDGHLEHQAAGVVRDASHHVQSPRGSGDPYVVLETL